jgi:hypothetical protein
LRKEDAECLFNLLTDAWKCGKAYFEIEPKTVDEYAMFTNILNDEFKKVMKKYDLGKESKLMRSVLSAIDEYCAEDWRKQNGKEH